jgi:murein DD-endopeptidase MepM/ murein hydrolase activator NlpD
VKYPGLSFAAFLIFLLFYLTAFSQRDSSYLEITPPLKRLRQTSGYGWRIHPITGKLQFHRGIDLAAHHDTVFSMMNGVVTKIGNDPLIGNFIVIAHPGDVQSLYGHLSVIAVLPEEQVTVGQPIGITGATGRVTGEHLHFSIKYHGRELSPLAFLYGMYAMPP